jgi:predicted ATP-dependent protease
LKGLTGKQGVMIPRANLHNLMLRPDVVEAARQGNVHIYAVGTIDEGIEVLTGLPAGQRDKNGAYPEASVNHRVLKNCRSSLIGRKN